jgi:uncharacterized phage-associated protein
MSKKLISAKIVTRYILSKLYIEAGDSITNLKLQEILYHCQILHLAIYNTPLFKEQMEFVSTGPIVPSVFNMLLKFGLGSVNPFDEAIKKIQTKTLSKQQRQIIDSVWETFFLNNHHHQTTNYAYPNNHYPKASNNY